MGPYTKGTTFLRTNPTILRKPLYADAHIHPQLRVILGCGPIANLKSTNTHGTQLRETETEQGEASGYYAWRGGCCAVVLESVDGAG